jgi:hypothetical protein
MRQICITNKEIQPQIYITLLSPQSTPPLPHRSSSVSTFYTSCNVFFLPTIFFFQTSCQPFPSSLYLTMPCQIILYWVIPQASFWIKFWCPCWYHIFPTFLHSQIIVIISFPTLSENFYFNLSLTVSFLLYNCHSLLLRHLLLTAVSYLILLNFLHSRCCVLSCFLLCTFHHLSWLKQN